MQQTKMTLQELMDSVEARLVELNYAPKTIYAFRCCWWDILSYAEEKNEKCFSIELGEKYLLERRGIDAIPVIDKKGCLQDLLFRHEEPQQNQCFGNYSIFLSSRYNNFGRNRF